MKKIVLIHTKNGFKLPSWDYEVDINSPNIGNYTEQDLREYNNAAMQWRVNPEEVDYWEVKVV